MNIQRLGYAEIRKSRHGRKRWPKLSGGHAWRLLMSKPKASRDQIASGQSETRRVDYTPSIAPCSYTCSARWATNFGAIWDGSGYRQSSRQGFEPGIQSETCLAVNKTYDLRCAGDPKLLYITARSKSYRWVAFSDRYNGRGPETGVYHNCIYPYYCDESDRAGGHCLYD